MKYILVNTFTCSKIIVLSYSMQRTKKLTVTTAVTGKKLRDRMEQPASLMVKVHAE